MLVGAFVMQGIDQAAQAQRIGKENKFLTDRRAGLPHVGKKRDSIQPFLRRQIHLAREGVQVPDQRIHNFFQARIAGSGHLLQRGRPLLCAH